MFDKYEEVSAKDHERTRHAGEVTISYELSITSPLPNRDVILKSKGNKRRLASMLCTFSLGENERRLDSMLCTFSLGENERRLASMLCTVSLGENKRRLASMLCTFSLGENERRLASMLCTFSLGENERRLASMLCTFSLGENERRLASMVCTFSLGENERRLASMLCTFSLGENERRLTSMLCNFSLGEKVTMDTLDDGMFSHDEADITMISYVIEAANSGKTVIRVLSDDTDVFVLLVYWVCRKELECKVQMERWDGTVLNINATCDKLGAKCLQLLGMHAFSGCDTTSYPYAKGKIGALNTLLAGDFPGLVDLLGEVGTARTDLMEAAKTIFVALYGQQPGVSMESAPFMMFTMKKKSPKIQALPPTSSNLLLHVLRSHLQVVPWKAADQQAPPDEAADITRFGWDILHGVPVPVLAHGDLAPPQLSDVISCQCRVQGKKCSTDACGCHKEHISCTAYCNCSGEEGCCNQYTKREEFQESVGKDIVEEEGEGHEDDPAHPDDMNDEWA